MDELEELRRELAVVRSDRGRLLAACQAFLSDALPRRTEGGPVEGYFVRPVTYGLVRDAVAMKSDA
jgi:hypothetical protein